MQRSSCWILFASCCVCLIGGNAYGAYTPESKEVKAMLDKGLSFLEKVKVEGHGSDFGGKAILAYTAYKHTHNPGHPLVQQGLQAVLHECEKGQNVGADDVKRMYSISVAMMLLAELDSQKYHNQIEAILQALLKSQKNHGGFGYQQYQEGDTSQVQYVMLAFWTAAQKGHTVADEPVERLMNWLLRTQDPSGGYGYMPKDPGALGRNIKQDRVTAGPCAAGTATTLIAADFLRFADPQAAANRAGSTGMGRSVRAVAESGPEKIPSKNVDQGMLLKSIDSGMRFIGGKYGNLATIDQFVFYYMYAFERTMSFHEKFQGVDIESPAWYNAGVDFLRKSQKGNGSWSLSGSYCGEAADTALAMLFLMRSTKQMIEESREGVLIGGNGLPTDVANLQTTSDGRVVKPEMFKSMDGLLDLLSKDDETMDGIGAMPEKFDLADDPKERASQVARLRRMAEGGTYQARRIALKALGQTRDFDNIPWLIYGLTDPDDDARKIARDGLRFMTRKFQGFGMSDTATVEDGRVAQEKWKVWYKTLRPEVEFVSE
ncbi:MAG: prenyltransferase/squalene oxidase repeat-containing protein [Pirellulaceae bacterium]